MFHWLVKLNKTQEWRWKKRRRYWGH